MKAFWISATILLALFLILCLHVRYLREFVEPLHTQLAMAAQLAQGNEWQAAEVATCAVYDAWDERRTYLHITLRHTDLDSIYLSLEEVFAYLRKREIGEYMAANQMLITKLTLLYEMEAFSLRNVL